MKDLEKVDFHLLIDREELLRALKTLALNIEPKLRWINISYREGNVIIGAGLSQSSIPARGHWAETIFVDAAWVRNMARSLPKTDPLPLSVRDGRFYTDTFSQSYSLRLPRITTKPKTSAKRHSASIARAAAVLSPFRVTESALEALVTSIRAERQPVWHSEEKAMIAAVAKAWVHLAPLGVDTSDLRAFLDKSIRHAFEGNK